MKFKLRKGPDGRLWFRWMYSESFNSTLDRRAVERCLLLDDYPSDGVEEEKHNRLCGRPAIKYRQLHPGGVIPVCEKHAIMGTSDADKPELCHAATNTWYVDHNGYWFEAEPDEIPADIGSYPCVECSEKPDLSEEDIAALALGRAIMAAMKQRDEYKRVSR